jgi:hypothetical protein
MATRRYYNADENKDGSQHIYGVPLADISDEEYAALPDHLQKQVDASPLYRKSAPAKQDAKQDATNKKEEGK